MTPPLKKLKKKIPTWAWNASEKRKQNTYVKNVLVKPYKKKRAQNADVDS